VKVVLAESVIDWAALLNVLWASLLGGVGVTAVFSLALMGATRAVDLRRDGRVAAATAYAVLTAVAGATVVAALVFGVLVMTAKD
jgi:hypothetical protein